MRIFGIGREKISAELFAAELTARVTHPTDCVRFVRRVDRVLLPEIEAAYVTALARTALLQRLFEETCSESVALRMVLASNAKLASTFNEVKFEETVSSFKDHAPIIGQLTMVWQARLLAASFPFQRQHFDDLAREYRNLLRQYKPI